MQLTKERAEAENCDRGELRAATAESCERSYVVGPFWWRFAESVKQITRLEQGLQGPGFMIIHWAQGIRE